MMKSAGAIAYMAKPVSDTSLFAAIDAAGKRPGG
jgi:FixJ family two-component response regulator